VKRVYLGTPIIVILVSDQISFENTAIQNAYKNIYAVTAEFDFEMLNI